MTIFAGFLKYLDEIGQASPNTLKAYKIDFYQAFADVLEESLPSEAELMNITKKAQVQWGSLQLASRQRKAATLKSFLGYLYAQNFISKPLADNIEAPKVPRKIPHFISLDEILLVVNYLNDPNTVIAQKESKKILTLLLYGGGLRISEACNLEWKQFFANRGELIINGKGGKERSIAIPRILTLNLQNLPRDGRFIWGTNPLQVRKAYEWIRSLGVQVGLAKPLHPHALRHSYATHLVTAGINLRALQELMGHANLTATEKYLHLSLDQLARIMETHHPLGNKS